MFFWAYIAISFLNDTIRNRGKPRRLQETPRWWCLGHCKSASAAEIIIRMGTTGVNIQMWKTHDKPWKAMVFWFPMIQKWWIFIDFHGFSRSILVYTGYFLADVKLWARSCVFTCVLMIMRYQYDNSFELLVLIACWKLFMCFVCLMVSEQDSTALLSTTPRWSLKSAVDN